MQAQTTPLSTKVSALISDLKEVGREMGVLKQRRGTVNKHKNPAMAKCAMAFYLNQQSDILAPQLVLMTGLSKDSVNRAITALSSGNVPYIKEQGRTSRGAPVLRWSGLYSHPLSLTSLEDDRMLVMTLAEAIQLRAMKQRTFGDTHYRRAAVDEYVEEVSSLLADFGVVSVKDRTTCQDINAGIQKMIRLTAKLKQSLLESGARASHPDTTTGD